MLLMQKIFVQWSSFWGLDMDVAHAVRRSFLWGTAQFLDVKQTQRHFCSRPQEDTVAHGPGHTMPAPGGRATEATPLPTHSPLRRQQSRS